MELKQKGASAQIGAFKQLKVSLIWTSAVDLDLMAFYKTKDGRTGGIYSDNYAGGSLGDLNAFPFMQLSGDEGVGASGGDNQEDLLIAKLDDLAELHICALNFTDASAGGNKPFANYDARVEVMTDKGDKHVVRLDSTSPGSVAVIAKFTSGFMGAELANNSEVMAFDTFKAQVPGAGELKLASKVTLATKGDSFAIKPKGETGEVVINLNWNTGQQKGGGFFKKLFAAGPIDLDLGCFFELINGEARGAIQPLGNQFGSFNNPPWVFHLGDDRSGAASEGENIKVNLEYWKYMKRLLVYAYIYEGVPQWAKTDAVVTVKVPGNPVLEVPLGETNDSRSLVGICMIENQNGAMKVTKLVSFHPSQKELDEAYGWGMRWVAGSK